MHDFPAFMKNPINVEGCYTLLIQGRRIDLKTGQEYFIAKGNPHGGEVIAGTRTIHAFGGARASRAK
jgi:hypothetical protein